MDAYFFTMSKRENSTKQPVLNTGNKAEIILKAPTSILNPVIEMDLGIVAAPSTINYMYIPDFGRYYWLTSPGWVWEDRKWVGYFTVDVLASWKSGIGGTSCYVSRSASSYDGNIIDNLYPGKAIPSFSMNPCENTIFSQDLTAGNYVVGIQGKNASANGGSVNYYIMDNAALRALCDYMLNQQDYQVSEISAELLKCIFNPLQYIVSCIWFPFSIPGGTATSGVVQFGWWTVTIGSGSIRKLGADTKWSSANQTINFPIHPQAATRGNYLKANPFTKYYFSAGPFGIITLSDAYALANPSLTFWVNVDLITGTGRVEIKAPGALAVLSLATAQIGVPIQMGQNVVNQGAITGMASDIGTMLDPMKNLSAMSGVISGGSAFIGDYLQSKFPVISSLGSNGNTAFFNQFAIIAEFIDIVDEDLADRGRPLCQVKTISSLSGYLECINPDPQIACSESELSEIIGYMSRGFYYE